MSVPGIALMDVVFSFDTTGSMSQALDEVKARVMDIIQKLQADIPGIRIGIITHGDYCDKQEFYDIRFLDLSDILADVVTFVNETEGTGGGDVPECYELALRQAKNMAWRTFSKRILVMIGDAYPHEPDYHLNEQNIDWRNELADLAAMNVHIYGVQFQNDETCTEFFNKLATATEGQHLQLANMDRVCAVIMGICYREQGPLMFQNYEAEMRHKEPEKFGPDLECVFGTLRHEVSRTSDVTAILDGDVDENKMDDFSDNNDDDNIQGRTNSLRRQKTKSIHCNDEDDDEIVKGNRRAKLKQMQFSQLFNSDSDEDGSNKNIINADGILGLTFNEEGEEDDNEYAPVLDWDDSEDFSEESDDEVKGNSKPKLKRLRTVDMDSNDDDGNDDEAKNSQVPTKKRKKAAHLTPAKQSKNIVKSAVKCVRKQLQKNKTVSRKSRTPANFSSFRKLYRERVALCDFKWEPYSWSPWHLAVCPKGEQRLLSRQSGKWKTLAGDNSSLWCTDLLKNVPATRGCSIMLELAVQAPNTQKKKVVNYHITKGVAGRRGVLGLSWYRGVFRSARPLLNEAALRDCKIFLRWARVKSRSLKNCQRIVKQYNYAWRAQPPRPCF